MPEDMYLETPVEPTETAPQVAAPGMSAPLSKKAQKRLAKAAYLAEQKKARRTVDKERKKEKKRVLAEKRAAGELDDEERDRKKRKTEQGPRTPFAARVVIDLGFDAKMTENEVKSLTSQLAYTYSANRKAAHPFSSLLFSSVNGKTMARMEEINNAAYKRWVGTEWWEEGFERLWEEQGQLKDHEQEGAEEVEVTTETQNTRPRKRQPSRSDRDSVVYLTADSDEELTELKAGETYIIGGIVDHNRYKNLCLRKSEAHRIRSARLPIGTYLAEMRTRKVLTVNQTFEILLKWVETQDWEQAIYAVMPKRKFNAEGRRGGIAATHSNGGEYTEDKDADGEEEVVPEDGDTDRQRIGSGGGGCVKDAEDAQL